MHPIARHTHLHICCHLGRTPAAGVEHRRLCHHTAARIAVRTATAAAACMRRRRCQHCCGDVLSRWGVELEGGQGLAQARHVLHHPQHRDPRLRRVGRGERGVGGGGVCRVCWGVLRRTGGERQEGGSCARGSVCGSRARARHRQRPALFPPDPPLDTGDLRHAVLAIEFESFQRRVLLTFLQKLISLRTSMMATSCGVVTTTAPSTRVSFKNCGQRGRSVSVGGQAGWQWAGRQGRAMWGSCVWRGRAAGRGRSNAAAAAAAARRRAAPWMSLLARCTPPASQPHTWATRRTHLHDGDVLIRGARRRVDNQKVAGAPVHVLEEPAFWGSWDEGRTE